MAAHWPANNRRRYFDEPIEDWQETAKSFLASTIFLVNHAMLRSSYGDRHVGRRVCAGSGQCWPGHSPGQVNRAHAQIVDFRYSPPEWQTAICLPDDPYKSLVDKSGELLYHYGQGGREFATRIAVEVAGNAVWQKQELLSPRVPIVRTYRDRAGIGDRRRGVCRHRPAAARCRDGALLQRMDGGEVNPELGQTGRRAGPVAEGHRPAQRRRVALRGERSARRHASRRPGLV